MNFKLFVLLCSFITCIIADDIELWNGQFIREVDIYEARDGWLYYRRADGSSSKAKLIDAKNIIWQDRLCRITRFSDIQHGRQTGKLLGVAVHWQGNRMPQPLIRVYALRENERGERQLRLHQNLRLHDPSRTAELPEVDAQAYREQLFFVEQAQAYHIEIWIAGELRIANSVGNLEGLEKDWWRQMNLVSRTSLTSITEESLRKGGEVAARVEAQQNQARPDCRIQTFSLNPDDQKKNPKLNVRYTLGHPQANQVKSPQIRFHYVVEDAAGGREIVSLVCQTGGRQVPLERGVYEGRVERNLPAYLRVSPTPAELNEQGAKRLLYWRLEFLYDDEVLAEREYNNRTIKRSLPDGWWK